MSRSKALWQAPTPPSRIPDGPPRAAEAAASALALRLAHRRAVARAMKLAAAAQLELVHADDELADELRDRFRVAATLRRLVEEVERPCACDCAEDVFTAPTASRRRRYA